MRVYAEVSEKSSYLGTVEVVSRKVRARVRGDELLLPDVGFRGHGRLPELRTAFSLEI